jgi:hypothetical protein
MTKNNFQTWSRDTATPFAKSLAVALIFSPWLIVIYSLVTNYVARLDPNDQAVIKGFIEWFGAAYSFFLALAVVNVWSQFETVEREFDRELDAITTLRQTVIYTKVSNKKKESDLKAFRDNVLKEIKEYLDHVVENYRLEHRISEQHRNGDRILENIGEEISFLTSKKVVPEPFIYELFNSLNEAMDVRGDRILHCQPYTPVIVQLVAIVSSVLWLVSFLGLVIYDKWVAATLVGGVAFVIIMVMVIFFDLGEPFGGIWRIHLDEWHEFIETMDHDKDPQAIFIYKLQNTVFGWVRAWLLGEKCPLYGFAHSKVHSESWKKFTASIQRRRQDGHPVIRYQIFYFNELKYNGISLKDCIWPAVVLKRGGDKTVIVDNQEIENCKDLTAFEDLFHQKMKAELAWYEQ